MFVFWWTGKGFLTPLILLCVLIIFGLILQAAQPVLQDGPWLWGLAFVVAGAINWAVGRKQNSRKIAAVRTSRFRDTLVYRARNKFMSLPFEVWSIPFIAGGLIAIAYSLTNSG